MNRAGIEIRDARGAPSVDAVIAAVSGRRGPAILDSADARPGYGRHTIVACDPVEIATWQAAGADPLEGMRTRMRACEVTTGSGDLEATGGFACGWIGYFAYEVGQFVEPTVPPASLGSADIGLPAARFAFYDTAAVHDAHTGRWTLVGLDWPGRPRMGGPKAPPLHDRFASWQELLLSAREREIRAAPPASEPVENMTRSQYLAMVSRAREYIAAGDIFQVNLARRESYRLREHPIDAYLRLRRLNPGAYAAYLAWTDRAGAEAAVLSASPELFLELRGGNVVTRPIKGTRPRSADRVLDAALQEELRWSEKDRAELAMIVDLERNDLGRVCDFGTVKVRSDVCSAGPYQLETHPTVHHLVATVTGRLRQDRDAIDLLRACFPGGSITGAPKVRAMQIIRELEPTERSLYTGAIGYLGADGSATLNIAIRTLIAAKGTVHLYAGGGIVADSVPEDEFAETQAKALGLRRALGAAPQVAGALNEQ